MSRRYFLALLLLGPLRFPVSLIAEDAAGGISDALVNQALERAGDNRGELETALERVQTPQKRGMRFLIAHMPERDLRGLTADYLVENVELAYRAWNAAPWQDAVPESIFLNDVLPYASINERRDRWRKEFYERFQPMIEGIESPGKAAAVLNQKIFPLLKVRYSTKRPKADQSPLESIDAGLASCSGLSVLLIDACRAVGIPARFVGTPLWSDNSGNHSWVEVWDDGWHFTGAAEPAGDALDRAWFVGRAASAQRDHRLHAIYATSFRGTPIHFPFVWDRRLDYVSAVNVTDRYVQRNQVIPEGSVRVRFRCVGEDRDRVACDIRIVDANGEEVFAGKTKDERFDFNDHVTAILPRARKYTARIQLGDRVLEHPFTAESDEQLESLTVK